MQTDYTELTEMLAVLEAAIREAALEAHQKQSEHADAIEVEATQ